MWKKMFAVFLLVAFAAQTFSEGIIYLQFYASQDYIAKNLCENRDKPQMHCCGKCQLCKRLNKEKNTDKQNPERKNSKEDVLSSKSFFPSLDCFSIFIASNFSDYHSPSPKDRTTSFFHPPGA